MEDSGSVISGSFVLQCILNETWESDIDIYIPLSMCTCRCKCLRCKKHIKEAQQSNDIASKLQKYLNRSFKYKKENIQKYMCYKNAMQDILKIEHYRSLYNNQIIELIYVRTNVDIFTYIHNTFDFDICKNIYMIDSKIESIDIKDMYDILDYRLIFNSERNIYKTLDRSRKYNSRGYDIIMPYTVKEMYSKLMNYKHAIISSYGDTEYINKSWYAKHIIKTECTINHITKLHFDMTPKIKTFYKKDQIYNYGINIGKIYAKATIIDVEDIIKTIATATCRQTPCTVDNCVLYTTNILHFHIKKYVYYGTEIDIIIVNIDK